MAGRMIVSVPFAKPLRKPLAWRMVCFFLSFTLFLLGNAQGDDLVSTQLLRVLSYNIHHGEGTDGRIDLERIARVIRESQPDLVALQEIDNKCERSSRVDQTSAIAKLTSMTGLFGKQIPFEGGEYGQSLLSRFPISEINVHWLPGSPDRQRRIAVSTLVDIGTQKLVFASTHLHHINQEFRESQAKELNELFARSEHPVILAGDFNATPESQVLKVMESRWLNATFELTDRLTYPSPKPERQLDYIFSLPHGAFTISKATVIDEPLASDHCPLLVEYSYQATSK